jgi:MFS family permease
MEKKLGLRENWQQFTLLIIVNAFVGGMVGLERSIIPQLAESEFGMTSKSAILSFITAFGFTKAFTNYFTGRWANRMGRKNLLLMGWFLAIPIPILIIYAPNWNWVVFANILLGMSQGLTWSSTVVMKIDLVGEKNRGLAMGLNEFAGYLAVGIVAFLTGYIAQNYAIRPYPFYLGIVISIFGLFFTIFWIKDTHQFVSQETKNSRIIPHKNIFLATTFQDKTLSSITQAGLVNNLNDGMIWGLLPILLIQQNLDNQAIGIITALYPSVWGIGQLFTGKLADIYPKKQMLFWGMFLQGIAIICLIISPLFFVLAGLSVLLGFGTALVYPTFLAMIAQETHPQQRAECMGVFRLWRDLGYAFGAIISGIIADFWGLDLAILSVGILTLISAVVIQVRMPTR